MATSIFFNGRVISVPGSYSEVDASGLNTVGLGATGIVAVMGTAEGGRPVSSITETKDIPRFRSAEKARAAFRSGDLKEVANILFAPAKDPDIPAGAVEFVALKTNPATQSTGKLTNTNGDVIDLTSRDYGAFTSQINVDVQSGTTKGKLLTIAFEDIIESVDDLGGDDLATLKYVPGPFGYQTALATVDSAGNVTVTATRSNAGLDGDIVNAMTNTFAEVVSADGGDIGQTIELFGLVSGAPTIETLTLNGTTTVTGSVTWDAGGLLGARITGTTAGDVTVRIGGGGLTVMLLSAGADPTQGLIECDNCFVNDTTLSLVSSGASTKNVLIFARDVAGAAVNEVVALNGTTSVTTTASTYNKLDVIVLGDVEAAQTVTVTVEAAKALAAEQNTILKVADYFNARQQVVAGPTTEGFIFTIKTGLTKFDPANFDEDTTGQSILDPADYNFRADLYAIIDWINVNSQLVTAAKSSGAVGLPDNTSTPVFLAGGIEGIATFTDYQNALNLLKGVFVSSIVDLSGDPAVAAALDAHCAYMGGIGRSERDGFVGLTNSTFSDVTTKDDAKAQIVNLNSRHIRACAQAIQVFDTNGEKTEFLPPFMAALCAGMQAGSPVGTSLTFKTPNVLGFRQHSSWNPVDDAEELIQAGLLFMEEVEGRGRRIVRNVTTFLTSNNIAFTEGSVNEAVNFAVFNLRTNLEFIVGKAGFAGTISATRGAAVGTLGLLVDNLVITGYKSLDVELVLDVMDVSVSLAPVIPINFVRTTVHLVTRQQLAEG